MKALIAVIFCFVSMSSWATGYRIAALAPNAVEMLFAIGAGEQIVATVEYADYPEAAQAIPRVGRFDYFDIEALMVLQPDLIVISKVDTNPLLLNQIEGLDVPIVDVGVSSIDQIPIKMRMLAVETGKVDMAEMQVRSFEAELRRVSEHHRNKRTVKVFYQVWAEPLTTVSSGWIDTMISHCGGQNVFRELVSDYPQVSLEQVLFANPEVILVPISGQLTIDAGSMWLQWPEIDAVAGQQIRSVDADLVHRSGPRALQGLHQICSEIDSARKVGLVN